MAPPGSASCPKATIRKNLAPISITPPRWETIGEEARVVRLFTPDEAGRRPYRGEAARYASAA